MDDWIGVDTHTQEWRGTPPGSSLSTRKPRLGSNASPTCRTLPCLSGNLATRSGLVRGSWETGCQTFRPRSAQSCSTGSAWVFWKTKIQQLAIKEHRGKSCKAPRILILATKLKCEVTFTLRPLYQGGKTRSPIGLEGGWVSADEDAVQESNQVVQPVVITELYVQNSEWILKYWRSMNVWFILITPIQRYQVEVKYY